MTHMLTHIYIQAVIDAVGAAGSFLDGGPSLPTQRAIVRYFIMSNARIYGIGLREQRDLDGVRTVRDAIRMLFFVHPRALS